MEGGEVRGPRIDDGERCVDGAGQLMTTKLEQTMTGMKTSVRGLTAGLVVLVAGAAVGLVGAGAVLAAGAAAVSAEPKGDGVAVLKESAVAIKALQSAKFKATHTLKGVGNLPWGGEVDVLWVRQPTGKVSLLMKGKVALPPKPETETTVLIDASKLENNNRLVVWVDAEKQAVYEQMSGPRTEAQVRISGTEELMLPPSLWKDEPFAEDLRGALEATEEQSTEINGDLCRVVRLTFSNPGMQRVIAVGIDDKLPRRYELIQGAGGKSPMSRVWEIKSLKVEKIGNDQLVVETPAGFKREKKEAVKPVAPPPPTPPAPGAGATKTPPTAPGAQPPAAMTPTGGLNAGAAAPNFELGIMAMGQTPEGKFRLDENQGNAVVLVFWSPLVPKSGPVAATAEKVTSRVKSDKLRVIGVGSRLEAAGGTTAQQAEAVAQFWKENNLSMPAAMGNDGLLTRLNVRGFPSVVVIDAKGKIAATFEGEFEPTALESAIASAIDAAK